MGGRPLCTLIGGGRTSPDRAAFHNAAAVRYLDFNDSFMAPGETCHPSDNLGPVLAAVEFAGGDGRDLLVSLAVAYQGQCRLSEAAPGRPGPGASTTSHRGRTRWRPAPHAAWDSIRLRRPTRSPSRVPPSML